MKRFLILILAVIMWCCTTGCSHYSKGIPIEETLKSQIKSNYVVAGVVDRRRLPDTSPTLSPGSTKLLATESKSPDVSGQLKLDDQLLLLSQPTELAVANRRLMELRQRLGSRYVLIGEQGGEPLTELSIWDMGFVIPTPAVIFWIKIPVVTSQEPGILHASRVIRLIDLEQSSIVGEHYSLLRDKNDAGEFTREEIVEGLTKLNLAKE